MADYKYQKIVFLSNDFKANEFSFSKNIQMSFTPTKMNVKSIQYGAPNQEQTTRLLYMERIGIIGSFNDLFRSSSLSFNLGNVGWTDGQYNFKVLKSDAGVLEDVNLSGRIVICLEFVG